MRWLSIFIFTGIIYILWHHESIRYNLELKLCERQYISDVTLVRSEFCQNSYHRTVVCDDAQLRLIQSVDDCASKNWHDKSAWKDIWITITRDYWSIWLITVPLIAIFMRSLISNYFENDYKKSKDKSLFEHQSELMKQCIENNPTQKLKGQKVKKVAPVRIISHDPSWFGP